MSSAGPSPKKASERRERARALQRAQRRSESRRRFAIYGVTALVVVAMAGAVAFALSKEEAGADLSGVKSYEVSQEHVTTPVNYEQEPPVGGEHNPVWLNCGTYPEPVPNENATHSLEHGAVWVTYRPDLAKDDVEDLEQSVPSTYMIVSPFPGLKSPVVASAWGKQVALKGVDDPRLDAFIREYRQGPQTPEMGAACTGGSDGTLPLDAGGTSQQ